MKLRTIKILTGLAMLAALAIPSLAQNNRIALNVRYTGTDVVGKAFAYDLENEIGRSSLYRYADGVFHLDVVSTSVDFAPFPQSVNSAISVVLSMSGDGGGRSYLVEHWVVISSRNDTASTAKSLMVEINGILH